MSMLMLRAAARTKLKNLLKEAAAKDAAASSSAANKGPTERSPHAKEVKLLLTASSSATSRSFPVPAATTRAAWHAMSFRRPK